MSSSPDCVFVYVTAPSEAEASAIAHALVEERLAACVNIIPHMRSLYRWQGKIEAAQEVVLIAKTRRVLFDKLEQRVKLLHSATIPCIVALPIDEGNPDFLKWIGEAVSPDEI